VERRRCSFVVIAAATVLSGCVANPHPRARPALAGELSSSILLHGKPLELHLSVPRQTAGGGVLVLYASGDGGWFGAAVDMFRVIGGAGYYAVGFSARSFLKLDRPGGTALNTAQLAEEYEEILAHARSAMQLDAKTPAILTGWSRGAAFAILAGSEPVARADLRGIIAIGLSEGEDLQVNGPEDETDQGSPAREHRPWPFKPYGRIAGLGALPCAVIQASQDNYLPASVARELFGPDTPVRRFYTVQARNHRFSGGKTAFANALLDAIQWISPPGQAVSPESTHFFEPVGREAMRW